MPRSTPARCHRCASAASRCASPGVAMPDRSPLMSAANTATPLAASCSASTCRVRVLPVPVAPATRPCRLVIASGMRTCTSGIGSPFTSAPISSAAPSKAYPSRIAAIWSTSRGPAAAGAGAAAAAGGAAAGAAVAASGVGAPLGTTGSERVALADASAAGAAATWAAASAASAAFAAAAASAACCCASNAACASAAASSALRTASCACACSASAASAAAAAASCACFTASSAMGTILARAPTPVAGRRGSGGAGSRHGAMRSVGLNFGSRGGTPRRCSRTAELR